jgi:hypothetical protein
MLLPSAEYEPFTQVVDAIQNYFILKFSNVANCIVEGIIADALYPSANKWLLHMEGIIADVLYSSADVRLLFAVISYQNVQSKMYVTNREIKN